MQHRIIVVETLAEVPVSAAQAHWRDRHAVVYAPTPLLAGYVQNRPLEEEWERLGTRSICSEIWFADRDAARRSFASDHYRDHVVPDESLFLDRDSAAMSRVEAEPAWPEPLPRYRVLAFGLELEGTLRLDREPHVVGSAWTDDRARALELARSADVFAFAAEPAVFRLP
jgi:EthD domain